jgi:DNA polymerase III sliding clamp (beta) subunit (PCNA family)
VKITANVDSVAAAFTLAATLASDSQRAKKIAALEAVRITAHSAATSISANVLDHAVRITLPATIETEGEIAVSGTRLAALVESFAPADFAVDIAADKNAALIRCGGGRFRLPTLPLKDLPPIPGLSEETGRVELEREQAAGLFKRPAFAVDSEKTRNYLTGIFLHDDYAQLIPAASSNTVTVDRIELAHALTRVEAVSEGRLPLVGLEWAQGEDALSLCCTGSDAADDVVTAEVSGIGRVALQIRLLTELLAAYPGKLIRLDSNSGADPVLISDPDDQNFLALQMPCLWARAMAA